MKNLTFLKPARWLFTLGSAFCSLLNGMTPVNDATMDTIRAQIRMRDSLQSALSEDINHSEILAERIKMYQSSGKLNERQHRNLEKLLRQAQTSQLAIDSVQIKLDTLSKRIESKNQNAIEWLQKNLTDIAHNAPVDSTAVNQIQTWLAWKSELESYKLPFKPQSLQNPTLMADANDSPKLLTLKGDMLADREEQFRQEINMIEKRISSLQVEADIRRKVEDFSEDLALFNEDEELMNRTLPVYSPQYPYNNSAYWESSDYEVSNGGLNISPGDKSTPSGSDLTHFPDTPLQDNDIQILRTPEMIENVIRLLAAQQNKLVQVADSLNEKADSFYKEAEDRREKFK